MMDTITVDIINPKDQSPLYSQQTVKQSDKLKMITSTFQFNDDNESQSTQDSDLNSQNIEEFGQVSNQQSELLIQKITSIFSALVQSGNNNKNFSNQNQFNSIYQGSKIPDLSIQDYIQGIRQYISNFFDQILLLALYYIDQYAEKTNSFVDSYNCHRLLLTALLVSEKYANDFSVNQINQFYSKIGGISLHEMNILEKDFLNQLQYQLFIDEIILNEYKENVLKIEL